MRIPDPTLHLLVVATTYATSNAASPPSRPATFSETQLENGTIPLFPAALAGYPEDDQTHTYRPSGRTAPHIAWGAGLHHATTGVPESFTIQLVGGEGPLMRHAKGVDGGGVGSGSPPADWKPTDSSRFIYVWIANKDQIFIAEVTVAGTDEDGTTTLTATYSSDFPGDYLVHIEEVSGQGQGRPLVGSPFSLTVAAGDSDGKDPTTPKLDVDSLPVCGSPEDTAEDIAHTFWRPGTWLSSNVASSAHGVLRNGWVFQPRTCVYDTFSYEDLMRLGALEDEPTWILILGGSVQRGVFLALVDMVVAQGQKDQIGNSVVAKCWGYADIQVGNLRLTYQDLRLYQIGKVQDSVVCNNEKLLSGSTSSFLMDCEQFLNSTIFQDGNGPGPTAILAPSNMGHMQDYTDVEKVTPPNFAIEVVMNALPSDWAGQVLFVEHMAGFECRWHERNPTMTAFKDVGLGRGDRETSEDNVLRKLAQYQGLDPRVEFMSVFPMNQAKLFENQKTKPGFRRYGASVHYHRVSEDIAVPETHNGARMVQSTLTEMLANIMIGKAVGTKAALYERVANAAKEGARWQRKEGGETFKLCWDCPASLVPVHVKPIPDPVCEEFKAFPASGTVGEVWDGQMCPDWCMKNEPVSLGKTESDVVEVRECRIESATVVGERVVTGGGARP